MCDFLLVHGDELNKHRGPVERAAEPVRRPGFSRVEHDFVAAYRDFHQLLNLDVMPERERACCLS
ncbi:MAG: hypothetical protein AB1758_06800 [Candidatus Eremiobacterota bacterium]